MFAEVPSRDDPTQEYDVFVRNSESSVIGERVAVGLRNFYNKLLGTKTVEIPSWRAFLPRREVGEKPVVNNEGWFARGMMSISQRLLLQRSS